MKIISRFDQEHIEAWDKEEENEENEEGEEVDEGLYIGKRGALKGLLAKFQVTLHAKMAMPDLQRYRWKICLIKYELDINVSFFLKSRIATF